MPNEYVTQRELQLVREDYNGQLARLRADIKDLEKQHDEDLKALAENRKTSLAQRIAAVSAGAGVLAAWVALIELWHASGR